MNTLSNLKIVIFLLLFTLSISAQNPLPKFMTEEEIIMVKNGDYTPYSSPTLSPPPSAVRLPAEWEEMQAVIIVWQGFNSILSQITEALKSEVEVIIVCNNEGTVKSYLTNQGIDYSQNVSFYELPSNSIWVRDYGPNSAYIEETGELVWIDWIYNRPRYKDDQVPQELGAVLNIPVYETSSAPEDLVNTGGNFMADGLGKAFSSELVLEENGPFNQFGTSNHSEEAVDGIMQQYMGLSEYIKMETLPYDLIHHIDMHMKLIDEETLIVGQYPEGVADGPQIEANIQYVIDQFVSSYGRPFNIVRIPMPPGPNNAYPNTGDDYRTYANALFANKTIIVPTYEEEFDTTAIRIWEEAMPGYDVVGINCNSIIPLSGALHCITKEVAASNPVTINMRREMELCAGEEFELKSTVIAYSEIESVNVFFREDDGAFGSAAMTLNTDNEYVYTFNALTEGSALQYYIEVKTADGKTSHRPLPAADGPRTSQVVNCSPVSIDEFDLSLASVFPNPASAITCIAPSINTDQEATIHVVDLLGRTIIEVAKTNILSQDKKFFFDASQLQNGSYFVTISVGNQVQTLPFIVSK